MDYHVPSTELVQIVRWQTWFWRSWGGITLGTGLINLIWVLGTTSRIDILLIDTFLFFVVFGLLLGLVLGFWVSVFTTLGLYKRQIKRAKAFWFCLYYAIGAAIMALGCGFLMRLWDFWWPMSIGRGWMRFSGWIGFIQFHMLNFIIASALVGWQLQRWLKQSGH